MTENLPPLYLIFGLFVHGVYFTLLTPFPFIELSDIRFSASIVLAILDHFLWFFYFTSVYYPFNEILAFFIICVWMIPFGFFVSLSANENTLPSGVYGAPRNDPFLEPHKKAANRLLSFFKFVNTKKSSILPEVVGTNTVKLG
eukprot:TRINITY_DN1296_c0_g1_i2.p1 TRINITY_DN1296_c0_g1~~TRINITY_DN1296_c0_g1_i2.p1  ORF type:complete len:143 (+),score=17.74 TRINITY_DN1296_c0_g1_i2:261-689(+)